MNASHPLCLAWQKQVKEFFTSLHGHQSKTLSLFVEGAIAANSIVVQRVAEALLAGSRCQCVQYRAAVRALLK